MRKAQPTKSLDLLAAAYLSGTQQRIRDHEIADRLHLSPSRVSRLLDEARESGLLRPVIFDRTRVSENEMRKIEQRLDLPGGLADRLNLQEVRIVFGDDLAPEAASHLGYFLRNAKCVGVAGGADCASAIQALSSQWWGQKHEEAAVFPIRGEPVGYWDAACSPTALAAQLQRGLGSTRVRSLIGIPAVVPPLDADPDQDRQMRQTLETYFRTFPDYREIVAALERLDAIVCSCDPIEAPSPWIRKCLETGFPDHAVLRDLAAGSVAGLLVPRPDRQWADLEPWNQRWIGIQRQHFEACAARAARDPEAHAGPILCAWSPAQAEVAVQACRLNLVSRLLLSAAAARQISRLVAEQWPVRKIA